MKPSLRVAPLLLSAALLALASCASLPTAAEVGVAVIDVRPGESTVLETSLELTLRVTNEGPRELAFAGSAHRLYVNDSDVGRAVSGAAVKIPAFGSATPTVTVRLNNLALLRKAAEFSRAPGKLAYRLESRLHPADSGFFGDIKVTTTGEIDLAALGLLPPVAPR